jgi:ankyrin repeat protein
LPIVKMLVEGGADVERPDNNGRTPLDIAREREFDEVVTYLQAEVLHLSLHLLIICALVSFLL